MTSSSRRAFLAPFAFMAVERGSVLEGRVREGVRGCAVVALVLVGDAGRRRRVGDAACRAN
ncbi:hypothetical protein CIK52_17580 [Kocuria rosea]|nr:hypothetical protein DEJ37_17630 [Kocuria rosea]PWF81556.1 hypothetical protein CIK52_17580 [Kocuria rosea]